MKAGVLESNIVVRLEIRNAVLERAARAVVDEAGVRRVEHEGEDALLISDCVWSGRSVDVLLAPSSAAGCTDALAWVWRGQVRCAIRIDDIDELAAAVGMVSRGWMGWWGPVAEEAHAMPTISSRQRAVLGGVVAGQSNAAIARNLHLSEATVKREVGSLCTGLGAESRAALVAAAVGFGIESRPVRP